MKKNEVIFVFATLALMFGVYFFIQKKLAQPPEEKQTQVKGIQQTDEEKDDSDGEIEYYEKHSVVIEARNARSMGRMQKSIDDAKPYLEKAQKYNKEFEEISKLPEKEQEKRLKEMIERRQEESKKHKQFKSEEEMRSYYETLRKKYPKEYSKYKKMIENE